MNAAQTIQFLCGQDHSVIVFNSGPQWGARRNPSYTKKGPGRRFAGRRAQIEAHPYVKRLRKAWALVQHPSHLTATMCKGAPYGVMLREDRVGIRDGVAYIVAHGHHEHNFGKVRVA